MHVTNINGVRVYNLTAGKSIPEWLSQKKRKALVKKDEELDKRIQLIQDFEMPAVTNTITMTKDGNYILASGMYKPRIRCYDVKQLSMKFERCVDAEIIKLLLLTEDYSKFVCLEHDRWVEFHATYGFHYRTRLPKIGRDMDYDAQSCEMYFVGNGNEVFRLNLQQGRFLNSLQTNARVITACQFNPVHRLFTLATMDGQIECWDPRDKTRAALFNANLKQFKIEDSCLSYDPDRTNYSALPPGFTCLSYRDALKFGAGTNFGMILLYDLRCKTPYLTKDHMYGIPIKKLQFLSENLQTNNENFLPYRNNSSNKNYLRDFDDFSGMNLNNSTAGDNQDLIASLDAKCLKIWSINGNSDDINNSHLINNTLLTSRYKSKNLTCIEHEDAEIAFNDFCPVPHSGMIFLAAEQPAIAAYYVPALGPAPPWFAYLDTLTEELENEQYHDLSAPGSVSIKDKRLIYDDYKFITLDELKHIGLDHLVGTPALRAYMHGYFIDANLYFQTKALIDPLASLDAFKKGKISSYLTQQTRQGERLDIVDEEKTTVNAELAAKLQSVIKSKTVGAKSTKFDTISKEPKSGRNKLKNETQKLTTLLTDDRFGALFNDPRYEINRETDEYKFINPIVSKLEKFNKRKEKNRQKFRESAPNGEEIEEESEEEMNLYSRKTHKELSEDSSQSSSADESYFFSRGKERNDLSEDENFGSDDEKINAKINPIDTISTNISLRHNKVPLNTKYSDSENANEESENAMTEIEPENMDFASRLSTITKSSVTPQEDQQMSRPKSHINKKTKKKNLKWAIENKLSKSNQKINQITGANEIVRMRRPVKDPQAQRDKFNKFRRKRI